MNCASDPASTAPEQVNIQRQKFFPTKHRQGLVIRFVPYASVLDLESSTNAKPSRSAFRTGCEPETADLRNSRHVRWCAPVQSRD